MAENNLENDRLSPEPKRPCLQVDDLTNNDYWRRVPGKFNLLIGCTGSAAADKIPELVTNIGLEIKKSCKQLENKIMIRIIATETALKFFNRKEISSPVFADNDEWIAWKKWGDPIVHFELGKWADMLIIAPLDANTLAKIANGLCDNLLTTLVRTWEVKKPVYFCPAMNTYMWEHPLSIKQVEHLKGSMNFKEIPCVERDLCSYGSMASVPVITSIVISELKKHFSN